MIDPIRQQQAVELANELIGRNTPIEAIIEQTGLPRTTVNNLVNSQLSISRPPLPMTQPTGIGGLQGGIPQDIADVMPNLGTDIADYLTDELGFDPEMAVDPNAPIKEPDTRQNLNIANAQLMIDDPSQAEQVLAAQKILSGQTDADAIDIYKQALANYAGIDYKNLIPLPDKDFAIMMAGLKLAEAGTKGEDWGTALSQSVTAGLAQYAKEKKDYTRSIQSIDLQKAMQKDKAVMDYIGKVIDSDLKLQNEMLTGTRKEYLVTLPGATEPTLMQLTSPQVGMYQNQFGSGLIKEYDEDSMGTLNNYIVTYNDGSSHKSAMTNALAATYLEQLNNGSISGFIKAGTESASDEFQVLVKDKNASADTPPTTKFVSKDGLAKLQNDPTKTVTVLPSAGTSFEVVDLTTDQLMRVPADQYYKNIDRYKLKRGLTASITNGDQTILIGEGDGGFNMLRDRDKGKEVETIAKQFRSRKFLTNQILQVGDDLEELILGMENPDLAFTNFAGTSLEFGRRVIATFNAFGKAFESATGTDSDGNSIEKFNYVDADGNNISYTNFKNNVLNSEGFKEFERSGLGRYITSISPDRARAQAALFNIALAGAAAAGGDPSPDLRAISDKDMQLFLKRVGADASNAEDFLAVFNDFRRDIIKSELNYYDSALDLPLKTVKRVKGPDGLFTDQEVDLFKARGLYGQADKRRKELEEKLTRYTTPSKLGTTTTTGTRTLNISLNPLQTPQGSISPLENTGYSLEGLNDATYEDLVNYAATLGIDQAKTFNKNLRRYFASVNNPQGFTIYLNFYKNAGIKK